MTISYIPLYVCHNTTAIPYISDAGTGVVDVAIVDPHGHKDSVRAVVSKRSEESWYVEYTPQEEGLHSINIFFAGKAIPNSPYGVGVSPGLSSQGDVTFSKILPGFKKKLVFDYLMHSNPLM